MGAARRFFAKTTVCSAAPARLSVVTQAQGTASHGFPVLHSHTNHQGSSRSSWELKSHFFFHQESLDPEQHYNRCLNHFFPAYSVIPVKTSCISLPHQPQMGAFGFLLIYFLTFLPKVSRLVFLSVSVQISKGEQETLAG